jgi:hypothetical protein
VGNGYTRGVERNRKKSFNNVELAERYGAWVWAWVWEKD